jgi:hypothetical protein
MQEELAVLKPGLEAAMGESEALMERVAREKREVVEPKKEIVDRDVRAADAKVRTSTALVLPTASLTLVFLVVDSNKWDFRQVSYRPTPDILNLVVLCRSTTPSRALPTAHSCLWSSKSPPR